MARTEVEVDYLAEYLRLVRYHCSCCWEDLRPAEEY